MTNDITFSELFDEPEDKKMSNDKCPHAELMLEYAKDALKYNQPWKLWECFTGGPWSRLETHPKWHRHVQYRRRPTPKPSIHVELIRLFLKDAEWSENPEQYWEISYDGFFWHELTAAPAWYFKNYYRRKPDAPEWPKG